MVRALLDGAAELLQTAPEDLELWSRRIGDRVAPRVSLPLAEIATLIGDGDGLAARESFAPPGVTFASGTHLAVV